MQSAMKVIQQKLKPARGKSRCGEANLQKFVYLWSAKA